MTEEEAPSETPKYQPPAFEYVRFDDNEISYRPIAVAGKYGEVRARKIEMAPTLPLTFLKSETKHKFRKPVSSGAPFCSAMEEILMKTLMLWPSPRPAHARSSSLLARDSVANVSLSLREQDCLLKIGNRC